MNKRFFSMLALSAALSVVVLSGCGSGSGNNSAPAPAAVYGVAASSAPISGTVILSDSSTPPITKTAETDADGGYSFTVNGLTAPFLLSVSSSATGTLSTFATGTGRANINPLANAAALAALANSGGQIGTMSASEMHAVSTRERSMMDALKLQLAELFQAYGILEDPISGDYKSESGQFSDLFSSITVSVSQGALLVINKQTGADVFSAPVNNIGSGTFYLQNMPLPTGSSCTYTYSAWGTCQSDGTQTRTVLTSIPAGCTGTPVLSQTCTYVPPAPTPCTYTYSAWGTCQSGGTQTRTVLTSIPAGCTGTPIVSQTCTYVPPAPALTLSQVKATCTMCHGLTVNTTVLKSGGYTVKGRTAAQWLTTVNTMVGYGAMLAPGFTAQDYANFLATLP